MLMSGVARAAVADLAPMGDAEMNELGLMSHAALLAELEEARRAGHTVVVLYPSDDSVDAASFDFVPACQSAATKTYVVVLDSTFSQARTLNRRAVPSWLPRISVTPRQRSQFALRDGGDQRAAAARTSTVEAAALLLETLDPSFRTAGHGAAWDAALGVLVTAGLQHLTWKSKKHL